MRLTLTLTTVLAATLAAATPANAVCNPPCTLYCVSPEPVGPLSTCDLSVCPVVYETLAEALAAAQATGSGSETEVCLLDSGAPLGTPRGGAQAPPGSLPGAPGPPRAPPGPLHLSG